MSSWYEYIYIQVGNDIELDAVGRQLEPYWGLPYSETWDAVPEQSWY